MAIDTGWNPLRLLFPQLAANDLLMYALDLSVTLLTGRGDVVAIDARFWVSVFEDIMGGMATGADGRYDQSALEKPFTVNGLGVILDDIFLGDVVPPGYFTVLAVAFAAQQGDVH